MLVRLFLFMLLFSFSHMANAEYYLVYQAPTSRVINLSFSTKTKVNSHRHPINHRLRRIDNSVMTSERVEQSYTCGCTPESCYVPKRDIYTAASTNCVTYDSIESGYR